MIWIITSPERIYEEASVVSALLAAGASRVLLRKPGWSTQQYVGLLEAIPSEYYNRLLIRDEPLLAYRYKLAGVHWSGAARRLMQPFISGGDAMLTERENTGTGKAVPATGPGKQQHRYTSPENFKENSTGIHSIEEITLTDTRFRTLLLSPVFNSISKPGYHGRLEGVLTKKDNRQVLALGGVDHTNIHLLKTRQFDGAALLGAIWKTPAQAVENYCRIQQIWNRNDLM
ncbi:thiamine phosphate synthase [Chitinophaga polysaccharea]|uniref:thiamine phosphate synthase n=1 Tax=Chitinophaga polysaccharea TaxID=1293035 RepID=UPI0011586DFF|nr:thiamine phosphate synthase [Chitinophaga polysaccharea]